MITQKSLGRIFGPRPKPLNETVSYEDAKLHSRYLGSIPHDYHSYSSWGGGYYEGSSGGGVGVYRDTPVYEPDGKPRVDVTTETIKARAYSVPLFAAAGAVGGGAVGFGVGALIGHLAGLSTGVTGGLLGGVAGLAGAFGAAHYAAGDNVRLEWREQPINEKRLAGYYHNVSPHYVQRCTTETDSQGKSHQRCWTEQDGWNHTFSPDVRYWPVGSYVAPKVVHFQDGNWKADPDPVEKDKAEEKPPVAKNL